MPVAAISEARRPKISPRFLPVIDRVLATGLKFGNAGKHAAINKVLQLVPEWRRGDCWQRMRRLRKTLANPTHQNYQSRDPVREDKIVSIGRPPHPRWTKQEDDALLELAGYEPVYKIAKRLNRSVRAVRFRLCALGMSGRVSDGWSLRALMKLLRISPVRLKQWIGTGTLRVRDPRIAASSLALFCEKNTVGLQPAVIERVLGATTGRRHAYTWERAADLLGTGLVQLQAWIAAGHLKLMDTFVTDRSFEEFCREHGSEINMGLIEPATAKWLTEEYGAPACTTGVFLVPRTQKHALKIRTCRCGRKIAGNVYFKHVKACKFPMNQTVHGSEGPGLFGPGTQLAHMIRVNPKNPACR